MHLETIAEKISAERDFLLVMVCFFKVCIYMTFRNSFTKILSSAVFYRAPEYDLAWRHQGIELPEERRCLIEQLIKALFITENNSASICLAGQNRNTDLTSLSSTTHWSGTAREGTIFAALPESPAASSISWSRPQDWGMLFMSIVLMTSMLLYI